MKPSKKQVAFTLLETSLAWSAAGFESGDVNFYEVNDGDILVTYEFPVYFLEAQFDILGARRIDGDGGFITNLTSAELEAIAKFEVLRSADRKELLPFVSRMKDSENGIDFFDDVLSEIKGRIERDTAF